MSEKSFIIKVIEGVTIFVYFLTIRGRVERFVIKLNFMLGKKLFEIARYDSGLHTPHLDLLRPDGKKDRTIDLSILENSQAMNVAIEDFTNNWSQYLERWRKWKKEREE